MARTVAFLSPFMVVGLFVGALLGGALPLPDAGGHGAWYASRAAGVSSYLFLWASLAGGLLMSSAWFDGFISRARLLAIHQSAAVAAMLLGLGHALVLIPDGWTSFTVPQVLVPFASGYERLETGIGGLALYLGTVVTASFWFRRRIGLRVWRWLHYGSFLVYLAALWHGIQLGTDTGQPWMTSIYLGTTFALVFGLTVRLTYAKAPRSRTLAGGGAVGR